MKEAPVKEAPVKAGGKQDAPVKKPAEAKPAEAKPAEAKPVEPKTRDADKSEIELPPNANEQDIRAIRGAEAMRRTEQRFGELLKKMKVGGDARYTRFDEIDAWPYEDGFKGMPESIKKLDGKTVAIAGFMLPIDEVEDIKTFYLVKSLWSCCYGIPPDVNGLVKIQVQAKKGVAYQYDPILVVGTLRLKKVMDEDYCVCIYVVEDALVRVIELD